MEMVLKLFLVLAVLYVLAAAGANRLQRFLMYIPDTERVAPQAVGLTDVEEVSLRSKDGAVVLCWWSRPQPGKPTLLYFHGNAGSLASRSERFRLYQNQGYGLLMMTYRSYGGSTGTPAERANVSDGKSAYDWLVNQGIGAEDIVLYGESLGSGIAVQVAAAKPVGGVILDAPYTSMLALAELHYPKLPSRFFMTDRYMSVAHIAQVTAPLLIIHGERDVTVPASMGRELYAKAGKPKHIEIFSDAGHADLYNRGARETIVNWLSSLPRRKIESVASDRAAE